MPVLIVSSSADQHINFMLKKMKKRGVKNFRFDIDKLGEGLSVTYTPSVGHKVKNHRGRELPLPADINSVWFRKPFMTRSSWLNKKSVAALFLLTTFL
ncbi:MAG: hypothetical protein WDZ85_00050 [Candidatus Paceibacterota bacterium]